MLYSVLQNNQAICSAHANAIPVHAYRAMYDSPTQLTFVCFTPVVGRPSCLPSCRLGWCWRVQLWRARGGQAAASPSLACRRPRAQQLSPSNESKRGVNPTHTEPQPDTAGGKHHRGETAHGEIHPPTTPYNIGNDYCAKAKKPRSVQCAIPAFRQQSVMG